MICNLIFLSLLILFYFINFTRSEIKFINQAIFFTGIIFFSSIWFWILFDKSTAQPQFIEKLNYLNIVGIDGISLFFIVLTTLLIFLCVIDVWNYKITIVRSKEYIIYFLVLEIFLIVSFSTLDLLIFYIFFESVLIPMFLIIGIWGSRERRIRADFYFFLYTLLGSVFMLFCILILFFEVYSTNFLLLQNTFFFSNKEYLLWFFSFIAFSVKIPMFPFHLWLPEAHVEAEYNLKVYKNNKN
jgi:NADH:ubiquinone oxidoreductase subunit 4 (subunit M)